MCAAPEPVRRPTTRRRAMIAQPHRLSPVIRAEACASPRTGLTCPRLDDS